MTEVITSAPTSEGASEHESDTTHESDTAGQPAPVSAPPAPRQLRQLMARYTGPRDMDGQLRLAANLAKARYVIPYRYRDSPEDIFALIHHAIALDIDLMIALDNLHFNPEGTGGMRARLMHALAIRAGHRVEVLHADHTRVRLRLTRGDGKPGGSASWTLMEAQTAGLIDNEKKSNWSRYVSDMLWARCMSRVTRRYSPEVLLGFYEVSELDDLPHDEHLDPVDLSTAMSDVDGNLVPAPDVLELLDGIDGKSFDEIRRLWALATEEGILGAYAGTVDDAHVTVEELLFNFGEQARAREAAQARKKARGKKGSKQDDATAVQPQDLTGDDQPEAQLPAELRPAGEGDRLDCGCRPAAVLADGQHEEGCARDDD